MSATDSNGKNLILENPKITKRNDKQKFEDLVKRGKGLSSLNESELERYRVIDETYFYLMRHNYFRPGIKLFLIGFTVAFIYLYCTEILNIGRDDYYLSFLSGITYGYFAGIGFLFLNKWRIWNRPRNYSRELMEKQLKEEQKIIGGTQDV